ncbi:hypothetical protein RhiTH_010090 [Rhizoctonia solani]
MGGNNNLAYLLPAVGSGSPPVPPPPFPPDYLFALGYEIFIISVIGALMLLSLPRTIRFLRSDRKYEGWQLYQSKHLIRPVGPIAHITGLKAGLVGEEKGTDTLSPELRRIDLPGLNRTKSPDGTSNLPEKGEDMAKAAEKGSIRGVMAQPTLHQGQGAAGAFLGWIGAKMTKFIGGPVMTNALVSLAPPFFIAPDRPAHIAIAQIPILFILGTKNNILTCMLGRSYEKLNFIHRSVVIKYSTRGVLNQVIRVPWVQAGLAAWIGLILVTFASIGVVRTKFYNFFLNSHMVGILVFMVAIHFHMPTVVAPYTISGLSFYLVDLVFRAWKIRIRPATINAIDDQMTLIEVHGVNDGWRAGQHVWLRILQGERSWESHPFTIANAPASHALDVENPQGLPSRGLLLYARAAGDFTCALNSDAQKNSGFQTTVIVDGPYGGLDAGMVEPASNRSMILVAGGGGVSFTIAILEDLVSRALEKRGCTKTINFLWVVKEHKHLNWYISTIKRLTFAAESSMVDLRVHLYVTKIETPSNEKFDRTLPSLGEQAVLDTEYSISIDVKFKRPDMTSFIGEIINHEVLAGQSSSGGGVMICACGPAPMVKDVQLATRRISIKDRRLAGGVSLHTEAFGL